MALPRAQPPRPPAPTRELDDARRATALYRAERATLERASVVRGILLVAALVLLLSIARAGLDRVFLPAWWRW